MNPHPISEAETMITVKDARRCLGVSRCTIYEWIRTGRLQSVKADRLRLIIVRRVRIIPPKLHRLPELHRLIDHIRPWYSGDTIDGLRQIVAAAEARLFAA